MNGSLPVSQRKKPWLREDRRFSRRHAWGLLVRLRLPWWGRPPPAQALPGRRDRQELKTEQLLLVPPAPQASGSLAGGHREACGVLRNVLPKS